ncbi:MAG TPA: 3'-5' exonuclease [Chloroflexota bacterium]|nr:3'-5' exonuclease [Chloroflexota bacterium]
MMARSLTSSAVRLGQADSSRIWSFIDKLQENPAQPGLSLERINQARDANFWSARVSQSLRAVIHRDGDAYTILFAGKHDEAYAWARTHVFSQNAVTGALQIVAAPELVAAILPAVPTALPGIFDAHADQFLLSLGLPPAWLPPIRKVVNEDQLLEICFELPEDVQERLFALAEGKAVSPPTPLPPDRPAIEGPDTRREFVTIDAATNLRKLLEAPLATWLVFLHPSQERLAWGSFRGPLKVAGSAGTGKTVVALHRANHLARQGKRVLLTTYTNALCDNLEASLQLLCSAQDRQRISAGTVHSTALALVRQVDRRVQPVGDADVRPLLGRHRPADCPLSMEGLEVEWEEVIQAQGMTSWDVYRSASRAGRGTPLSVRDRKTVWTAIEAVQTDLRHRGLLTYVDVCRRARELLQAGTVTSPFDAVIVDEVQDLGPQELLLLSALGGSGQDGLTLVGDGGQRIYGKGTSLKSLGIDVRGRSHILRLNYRTTEQIRRFAERIIHNTADDLDGGRDDRRGVRSVLAGPQPLLRGFATAQEQYCFVVDEIGQHLQAGLQPNEIAIFARRKDLLERLKDRLHGAGFRYRFGHRRDDSINLATMHSAKGLEYKIVFVIDVCDDQVPQGRAYRAIADEQAREDALRREAQLLYVSITRARDEVYLTWVGEKSRFLREST